MNKHLIAHWISHLIYNLIYTIVGYISYDLIYPQANVS